MRTVLGTAVVMLALGACSERSDALAPGTGDQVGTGTGTLGVDAFVAATPNRFNAAASTDFEAEFSVRVMRRDQTVSSGTVTITTPTGKVPLTYQLGRWRGSAPSYDEIYILDIASGADRVDAVRIDAPDIHVFSAPAGGSTIDLTMPVAVAWRRRDEADAAAVRTDSTNWLAIEDTGAYAMSPTAFKPDSTGPKQHTLRLSRTNRLAPGGATEGSSFRVTIENRLSVNTDANPPL